MDKRKVAAELVKIAKRLTAARMKIKPEDYKILKSFLDKAVRKIGKDKLAEYKEKLKTNPKVRDADMRFRWDLLHASRIKIGDGKGMRGDVELYGYMNDNQIDTALKTYIKSKKLD